MISRVFGLLSLVILAVTAFSLFYPGPADKSTGAAFEPFSQPLRLPILEDEASPYFSRELKMDNGQKREEVLCFRKDKSVAHLVFGEDGLLVKTKVYRQLSDRRQLVYEADYARDGRRINHARFYADDARLETEIERLLDGSEKHRFFRAGVLLQCVELAADGSQTTLSYDKKGAVRSSTKSSPPTASVDLVFWDKERSKVRLRIQTRGARLETWEYFGKDGSVEHSGKTLADGTLEFSYMDKGKLKRRQQWRLVGEDWERAYYGLAYSELFADDGKTVEHKVWLRSNGHLKRHERFDAKSGKLEMQREFDSEGRVARVEDFTIKGDGQKLWIFPASGIRSRGFVPTGMREYPGEDKEAGGVYNLDGNPFSHSVLDRHPWAFFEVR